MKLKRLFSSFKHKLLLEGVLASCLSGGIVAGGAAFVVSFVYHVLAMPTPMSILWLASGVGFALTFALVFALRFYPTKKRIARRLDETGLQERASTMIAFWKEEEGMAKLQREDATRHIEKKRAKDIKLRIGKWQAVMCLVCVLLATTMVLLPIDIFVFATGREVYDPEKDALIDKLIEQLREEVKNTQLSDEIKEDIDEIIDRLEEDLKDAESELEQAGKVEDAKQEISERLEQELTKNSIGLELQKFTLTRPLGEALCETNKKKVSSALDALESKIKNDHYSARELADLIKRALQASEVPASDALYSAFDIFADELNSLDVKDPSFDSKVTKSFSTVEAKILDILTQQAVIESEKVIMQ